eukprot:scaffold590956_cov17-Prasinocladus_malaysianus.AAC.1
MQVDPDADRTLHTQRNGSGYNYTLSCETVSHIVSHPFVYLYLKWPQAITIVSDVYACTCAGQQWPNSMLVPCLRLWVRATALHGSGENLLRSKP